MEIGSAGSAFLKIDRSSSVHANPWGHKDSQELAVRCFRCHTVQQSSGSLIICFFWLYERPKSVF